MGEAIKVSASTGGARLEIESLKGSIEALSNTIKALADALGQFVTEMGKITPLAEKIADSMGKIGTSASLSTDQVKELADQLKKMQVTTEETKVKKTKAKKEEEAEVPEREKVPTEAEEPPPGYASIEEWNEEMIKEEEARQRILEQIYNLGIQSRLAYEKEFLKDKKAFAKDLFNSAKEFANRERKEGEKVRNEIRANEERIIADREATLSRIKEMMNEDEDLDKRSVDEYIKNIEQEKKERGKQLDFIEDIQNKEKKNTREAIESKIKEEDKEEKQLKDSLDRDRKFLEEEGTLEEEGIFDHLKMVSKEKDEMNKRIDFIDKINDEEKKNTENLIKTKMDDEDRGIEYIRGAIREGVSEEENWTQEMLRQEQSRVKDRDKALEKQANEEENWYQSMLGVENKRQGQSKKNEAQEIKRKQQAISAFVRLNRVIGFTTFILTYLGSKVIRTVTSAWQTLINLIKQTIGMESAFSWMEQTLTDLALAGKLNSDSAKEIVDLALEWWDISRGIRGTIAEISVLFMPLLMEILDSVNRVLPKIKEELAKVLTPKFVEEFGTAVDKFFTAMGDTLVEVIKQAPELLKALTNLIPLFIGFSKGMIEGATDMAKFFGAVDTKSMQEVGVMMGKLFVWMQVLGPAITMITSAIGGFGQAGLLLGKILGTGGEAAGAATGVGALSKALASAGPLALALAGFGAALYFNWDELSGIFNDKVVPAWDNLTIAVNKATGGMDLFGAMIGIVKQVVEPFNDMIVLLLNTLTAIVTIFEKWVNLGEWFKEQTLVKLNKFIAENPPGSNVKPWWQSAWDALTGGGEKPPEVIPPETALNLDGSSLTSFRRGIDDTITSYSDLGSQIDDTSKYIGGSLRHVLEGNSPGGILPVQEAIEDLGRTWKRESAITEMRVPGETMANQTGPTTISISTPIYIGTVSGNADLDQISDAVSRGISSALSRRLRVR